VRTTAQRHLRTPAVARVESTAESAPDIEHVVYQMADGQRWPALQALLDARGHGTTLVFGRTKHGVKNVARRLEALGYPVAALQGNLSQNARDRVMEDVRSGRVPILVATNVAARGIDVAHIGQVINYELPETPELFTHRVGRTGRMGRSGVAITLLESVDLARWTQFERALGRRLPRTAWPSGDAATRSPRGEAPPQLDRGRVQTHRATNGARRSVGDGRPQHAARVTAASPARPAAPTARAAASPSRPAASPSHPHGGAAARPSASGPRRRPRRLPASTRA
jgi:superfamily II DNA/RNA helicase